MDHDYLIYQVWIYITGLMSFINELGLLARLVPTYLGRGGEADRKEQRSVIKREIVQKKWSLKRSSDPEVEGVGRSGRRLHF